MFIKKYVNKNHISNLIFFMLFAIVFLFIFFTMDYNDGRINASLGYVLCRGVLTGTLWEVYSGIAWSYGVVIYVIYAIWSLPVVVIDLINGTTVDFNTAVWSILWYKLLLVLFWGACCYWFYKIQIELNSNKSVSRLSLMFLVTSGLMIIPTIALTQCDVMSLNFALMGVYYLLKKDNKRFVMYFAIAATMKYLALFIFLPLLLFQFKKIVRLAMVGVAGISLTILMFGIQMLSKQSLISATSGSEYYVNTHIGKLFSSSILTIGKLEISIFIVFLLTLCLVAYMVRTEQLDRSQFQAWVLWIAVSGWYALLLFYEANIYWFILLMPFLILLFSNNPDRIKENVFLEIIFTNAVLLKYILHQGWTFGGERTFSGLLLKNLVPSEPNSLFSFIDIMTGQRYSKPYPPIISVIIFSAFAILIINNPFSNKNGLRHTLENGEQEKVLKMGIISHLVILYGWVLLIVVAQFLKI